jgi:hypothetical protein
MLYTGSSISLLLLLGVALIYAALDVFNNRNVPNWFAYACVVIGLAVTFAFDSSVLVFSLAVAAFVGAFGYFIYRAGFWGAGDVFELVAVSLLLPVQPAPLAVQASQLGLPFVLSVFIATGISAIWLVPAYYLLTNRRKGAKSKVGARRISFGALMLATYAALFLMICQFYGFSTLRLAILLMVAIPSVFALIFEERITAGMVRLVHPRELEEEDMLALNLMSKKDVERLSKKYRSFGRLVTRRFIAEAKASRERLPVYRNAPPLALFILMGVVASLLFGNLVLLMM